MMKLFDQDLISKVKIGASAPDLSTLLSKSSLRHSKLCPRQVLGVRMGLYGNQLLGYPNLDRVKRLIVILETDGCFADGIEVSTGCTIGQRTLRIKDYGKIAATFINLDTTEAVRIAPKPNIRERAYLYAWQPQNRYTAQLEGYQVMPDEELFFIQKVNLMPSLSSIMSVAGKRILCHCCGEEIINQREIISGDQAYCQTCLGHGYYQIRTDG